VPLNPVEHRFLIQFLRQNQILEDRDYGWSEDQIIQTKITSATDENMDVT